MFVPEHPPPPEWPEKLAHKLQGVKEDPSNEGFGVSLTISLSLIDRSKWIIINFVLDLTNQSVYLCHISIELQPTRDSLCSWA